MITPTPKDANGRPLTTLGTSLGTYQTAGIAPGGSADVSLPVDCKGFSLFSALAVSITGTNDGAVPLLIDTGVWTPWFPVAAEAGEVLFSVTASAGNVEDAVVQIMFVR